MHERFFPGAIACRTGCGTCSPTSTSCRRSIAGSPASALNRPAPVSFHDADHGARDGSPLRPWIEERLAEADIDLDGGPVRILAFPRVFGYAFNPISVWFCHGPDGELRAILYEVSNTFGEWHDYLVPVSPGDVTGNDRGHSVRTIFDKELFVSPFIDMAATYDFSTRVPDERVSVVVRETAAGGQVLVATLGARRRPLTGRSLASVLLRYPLVTVKVIGGIHWEALKLWRKGAPYRRRGTPPASPMTVVAGANRPARVPSGARLRPGYARAMNALAGTAERRILDIVGSRVRAGRLESRSPTARTLVRRTPRRVPPPACRCTGGGPLRLVTTTGAIGLADAYVRGDYDVDDLEAFLELCALHLEPDTASPCRSRLHRLRTRGHGGCSATRHAARPAHRHRAALRPRQRLLRRVARPDDDLLLGASSPAPTDRSRTRSARKYERLAAAHRRAGRRPRPGDRLRLGRLRRTWPASSGCGSPA